MDCTPACSSSHLASACSTLRKYRRTVIAMFRKSGNHRYMKFSILIQDCGWMPAFSRLFKRNVGIAPKDYKRAASLAAL